MSVLQIIPLSLLYAGECRQGYFNVLSLEDNTLGKNKLICVYLYNGLSKQSIPTNIFKTKDYKLTFNLLNHISESNLYFYPNWINPGYSSHTNEILNYIFKWHDEKQSDIFVYQ